MRESKGTSAGDTGLLKVCCNFLSTFLLVISVVLPIPHAKALTPPFLCSAHFAATVAHSSNFLHPATLPLMCLPPPVELPVSLKLMMKLAFSMLSFVLRNPTRKASPFSHSTLNSYLSIILTFLATVTKHAEALSVLE